MKLIDAAIKIGAKTLVLPECGHAYMALRWMGANMYGKPLPFKVMHISEYMADALNTGKIKVKKLDKSVTYHDPCQVSRRGGATQAARDVSSTWVSTSVRWNTAATTTGAAVAAAVWSQSNVPTRSDTGYSS